MSRRVVRASVQLLSTNEGGRSSSLRSGYRSILRFEGTEVDFGFELELDTKAATTGLAPGELGEGRLTFWASEALPTLYLGQRLEIREGNRIVGYGIVTQV